MRLCIKILLIIAFISPLSALAQNWQMVWSDEFNDLILDESIWTREVGGNGWGNNELQYYTDRTVNSFLQNGKLVIKAMEENFGSRNYTSARLKTQNKKFFKYGKMEARIKLPFGKGLWPAFWMLGQSFPVVGWPACGEIDIMELVGGPTGDNKVYGTAHWEQNGQHAQYGGNYILSSGIFADDFHLFSITWDPQEIKWYVDDILYQVINITPQPLSEFHEDFFFILNVAVGGNWPGDPDPTTQFPQTMEVDYVRVYQDANSAPSVNIYEPTNNSVFDVGSDISIKANASDSDGTIEKVEFYQDDGKIGEDLSAPYEMLWENIYEGCYTITAIATDNVGITAISDTVNIIVGNGCTKSPYLGSPATIPGFIEMEYYDLGGQDVGYYDLDVVNRGNVEGNSFRMNEGVDTESNDDLGGGINVGWIENGEWLSYYISATQSGMYKVQSRVASDITGGVFHIEVDNVNLTGPIQVPATGGWQIWQTITTDSIWIDEGDHFLKIVSESNGYNLNKILFSSVVTSVAEEGYNPLKIELFQNYPNPFNPETIIAYSIPYDSHVNIILYNVLGEKVADLVNEVKQTGYHELLFNAANFPSGIYFYKIQARNLTSGFSSIKQDASQIFVKTKKMVLMR